MRGKSNKVPFSQEAGLHGFVSAEPERVVRVKLASGAVVAGTIRKIKADATSKTGIDTRVTRALIDLAGAGTAVDELSVDKKSVAASVGESWLRVGHSLKAAARRVLPDGSKPSDKT